MDGFDSLGRTKLIMATNRPDTLDPALLRPGRLDRKIEVPLPNEQARLEILKIHAGPVNKGGDIDYEAIVKLSDTFNGADLRNVVTEAGMFAIRDDREYINQEDLTKAARKVAEAKKHESEWLCSPWLILRLLTCYPQPRWNIQLSIPHCTYPYTFLYMYFIDWTVKETTQSACRHILHDERDLGPGIVKHGKHI
jgi:hypothetical protein